MKSRKIKSFSKKALALSLVGIISALSLTACGKDDEADNDGVQKIVVGVPSTVEKWGNLDENGELDGYEIAVLKAIDEKLTQYEFEFQASDFSNILLSLDTGKIDLGTHMFEYNEERGEKYLYGKEGYIDFSTYFIVPVDSENTTWESLAGKVVGNISETDNGTYIIKQYNEENPDKAIELDYYGSISTEVIIQSLLDGRWDAIVGLGWSVDSYNQLYGNGEDIVKQGDSVGTSLSYYLYPKDGEHEELQQAVDSALKELKEDGTLKQISEKYIGLDVTP
jgi:L-cystine transport system substrate-binding protein